MRRRKLLSLFLSLCLCLSLLPTAVLAEDVQTEPLTEVSVTFPAPQVGDNIKERLQEASIGGGLSLQTSAPVLWQGANEPVTQLPDGALYEAGKPYLLVFMLSSQSFLTPIEKVTCNGEPVELFQGEDAQTAFNEAVDAYGGTYDACFALNAIMKDAEGEYGDTNILYLYAFVYIPKVVEVDTADALRTAI